MISVKKAIEFAAFHFPDAPEKLAEHLRIDVRESPMDGCDGWCLVSGDRGIIRINSNLSNTRKRFTLAHELGHLILGVPTMVGESFSDMLGSDSDEERSVNDLASNLLIPLDVIERTVSQLPVVAADLRKLAKLSKVSELATAIRVCNVAGDIGLVNASVVLFDDSVIRWQWSRTLKMSNQTAINLLREARKASPRAFREQLDDGNVVVASTIENPSFGSATLFVQLLPGRIGMQLSRSEKRKQLEQVLFDGNSTLQQSVSGLMGAHKGRIQGLSQEQSVQLFWDRNRDKLKKTTMNSEQGREYVRLRISEWF